MKRAKFTSQTLILAITGVIFSGCAVPATVVPSGPSITPAIGQPAQPTSIKGMELILGLNATQLQRNFGKATLDVRESNGRKLQFRGGPCILDVYLYGNDSNSEVATHVDARRSDGAAVDRESCVKALSK